MVEVVSEDDPDRDLVTKRLEYAQARIPEYWIVDPRNSTVMVLRLEGESYQLDAQYGVDETAVSRILPQLQIPVQAVFEAE